MIKKLTTGIVAALLIVSSQAQQLNTPQPSPTASVKQNFALSNIEISYSRPGIKGRKIFGDLVPYGKVWRTGANNATTITFGEEVTIGNTKIPAGKYGLLTIPDAASWTIIISKQTNVTSPADYKQDQDVARVKADVVTLPFSIETFAINVDDIKPSSCTIGILWDNVYVGFPVKADVEGKVMKQINDAMEKDNRPYFASAMYYMDNGKDLNKALDWFNKAEAQSPDAFWVVHQKANCLAKLGKKQEAIAAANKSKDMAQKAGSPDYVALNEKLIASLK
jgi:hypothetical protein